MSEYRGKAALKMIAARLDSDPDNPRVKEITHVDNSGDQTTTTEKDFLWHLVRWAADYDISWQGRVALFTGNSSIWTIELWSESDNANPIHIFYLYF